LPTATTENRFASRSRSSCRSLVSAAGKIRARHSVNDPLPAVTSHGAGALIEPFVFANRTNNAPKSIDEPVPPLCTGNHIALVEPFLVKYNGTATARSVDEPVDTIPTKDRFGLVTGDRAGYVLGHSLPDAPTTRARRGRCHSLASTSSPARRATRAADRERSRRAPSPRVVSLALTGSRRSTSAETFDTVEAIA